MKSSSQDSTNGIIQTLVVLCLGVSKIEGDVTGRTTGFWIGFNVRPIVGAGGWVENWLKSKISSTWERSIHKWIACHIPYYTPTLYGISQDVYIYIYTSVYGLEPLVWTCLQPNRPPLPRSSGEPNVATTGQFGPRIDNFLEESTYVNDIFMLYTYLVAHPT